MAEHLKCPPSVSTSLLAAKVAVVAAQGSIDSPPKPHTPPPHEISGLSVSIGLK